MIDTTKPPPAERCDGCTDYAVAVHDCYTSVIRQRRVWDLDDGPCDPCRAHYDPVPPERWRCVVCGDGADTESLYSWCGFAGSEWPLHRRCVQAFGGHAKATMDATALRFAALAGHHTAEERLCGHPIDPRSDAVTGHRMAAEKRWRIEPWGKSDHPRNKGCSQPRSGSFVFGHGVRDCLSTGDGEWWCQREWETCTSCLTYYRARCEPHEWLGNAGRHTAETTCPACDGTGRFEGQRCLNCDGTGKVLSGHHAEKRWRIEPGGFPPANAEYNAACEAIGIWDQSGWDCLRGSVAWWENGEQGHPTNGGRTVCTSCLTYYRARCEPHEWLGNAGNHTAGDEPHHLDDAEVCELIGHDPGLPPDDEQCGRCEMPAPTEHPVARWEREGPRCYACVAAAYWIMDGRGSSKHTCDAHRSEFDSHAISSNIVNGGTELAAPGRSERIAYELERRARAERYEVVCDVTDVEDLL